MFEKGRKPENRKLDLEPRSLISTFILVLLLAIHYSNNTLLGLQVKKEQKEAYPLSVLLIGFGLYSQMVGWHIT